MPARRHVRRSSATFTVVALIAVGTLLAVGGGSALLSHHHSRPAVPALAADHATAPPSVTAPRSPTRICGTSVLDGPRSAPRGARVVPAGLDRGPYDRPATTYWFAPGVHTLGTGDYDQIGVGQRDTYIGAPDAVLNGQGKNDYAFVAPSTTSTGVTVEYLTIEDFVPPGGNGAVNVNAESGWRISHDTIEGNSPGAGVMLGTDNVLSYSCVTENGEYGFQTYTTNHVSALTHGAVDITVDHNEISFNDTYNWEVKDPGCGCSGGAKFWQTDGAVVADNWVHNNHNVGLWMDTDNDSFTVTGNYIAGNYSDGLIYEISYNAVISGNAFVRNGIGVGPTNPGFPTGAIYVSESGGDARVPSAAGITSIKITGNAFADNWSGVVLWENSNRFCGSPDNSSSSDCTLVDPSEVNLSTCVEANLQSAVPGGDPDYYDDCRWKTQDVSVSHNAFDDNDATIAGCRGASDSCGENGVFSEDCSNSSNGVGWSPYCRGSGDAVPAAISRSQRNVFSDNSYVGPWSFMVYTDGHLVSRAAWQTTWGQDHGSTFG